MNNEYDIALDGDNLVASTDNASVRTADGERAVVEVNSSTPARPGIYEPSRLEARAHGVIHKNISVSRRVESLRDEVDFEFPSSVSQPESNAATVAGSLIDGDPQVDKLRLPAQALRYIQSNPGLSDVVKTNLAIGVNPSFNETKVGEAEHRVNAADSLVSHIEDEVFGCDCECGCGSDCDCHRCEECDDSDSDSLCGCECCCDNYTEDEDEDWEED